MSKFDHSFLCVYGHFNQPPRGNPLTGEIGAEPLASPHHNWNERISEACYRPNAEAGNFQYLSYSFGETLLSWLKTHQPEIYTEIIEADRVTAENHNGHGNAVASAYHHLILPLARKRDKRTQILWGMAAFEHHFGRRPEGFWLPEMAVDTETLNTLADAGIEYTLLAARQIVSLPAVNSCGPFEVQLTRGRKMRIFVREDQLSSDISFNIHNLGGAGYWARNALATRQKNSGMLLLATEGETFGHHYAGEEQFLRWLVRHEALAVGYRVTSLNRYHADTPSGPLVTIREPSSWSDQTGLANWATGLAAEETLWKGSLRRALDNAASEIDRAYEDLAREAKFDPWELRNRYITVLLGQTTADQFISEMVPSIDDDNSKRLASLLTAQELAQRMYTSYTFTGDRLDGVQPRYAIACAAAALSIAEEATGRQLAERLLPDLAVVTARNTSVTGADILNQVLVEFDLSLKIVE